ncbi:MAG: hypothetical protein KC456_11940 [Flavobacteriales bacterium]|jgi:hypothetical protein|nr:hypothetical protein [Flavobacteriales bacterium]
MTNYLRLPIFSLILILTITSCKEDEEPILPTKPSLPPSNSFIVDMSGFGQSSARGGDSNYNYAAANVGLWNTALFLHTALPIKAWNEVRTATAVWDKNENAWVWRREFSNIDGNYTASLYGWVEQKKVQWRMYVTKHGFYERFLWYRGTSNTKDTRGDWSLFKNPNSDKPYLEINWVRNDDDLLDEISYTNVAPNDPNVGSYIHFGFENELKPDYPMYYDIYGALSDRLIGIDYDDETTAGRIKDSVYFETDLWNCWDEDHVDIECP